MEKRIARLAYNTNGWIMPTGPYGKGTTPDSYEAMYGFGHEEWLFDLSKIIEGYHYGFLEPIRKSFKAFSGHSFSVWLYTIDGISKKRYWVGEISKIDVLSKEESNHILSEYKKRGWYQEMETQVMAAGGDQKAFANWYDLELFNVRFKHDDLKVNDPYIELPVGHHIYNLNRYTFAHYKDNFNIETKKEFSFSPVTVTIKPNIVQNKIQVREPKTVEIANLHKTISSKLAEHLMQKYGQQNIALELSTGYDGSNIDIVVNAGAEGFYFYEVKTYNSIKTSIRESIGQLMEYAYYPSRYNAAQLIIVTQKPSDADISEAVVYINHLRKNFKLPVYYQWFDYQTNTLSEKY